MKTIKNAKIVGGLITDGSEQIMYESYDELKKNVPDAITTNCDNDTNFIGYVKNKYYTESNKAYIQVYSSTDTFKIVKIFKRGDKVKVICDGNNASQFKAKGITPRGVYDYDWESTVFEISGTVELVSFDCFDDIFCAYLLKLNGSNAGFVYNTALELCEEETILTYNEIAEKFGVDVKQLKIKK